MTPHAIVGTTGTTVECDCGWSGTRGGHELHRRAETAAEGIAAARQALEEANGCPGSR